VKSGLKTKIPYSLLALAALTGCFKDVSYETEYILKPLVQQTAGDVLQPVEGAMAYAFAADTAEWTVASYADACAGVITSRTDPSRQRSDAFAAAEPVSGEGLEGRLGMTLPHRSQMVVAVDPADRLYAFTQQNNGVNLDRTYVTLIFKPYREGNTYKEGDWIFCNEFYTPPVYLDCGIVPRMQAEEGGETSDFPVSNAAIKAYAFAADTALWRIASYADAVSGIITSKLDPGQRRENPNFTAYPEEDGYRMTVSSEVLMVVVVDRSSSMYAYSKQTVDLTGESPLFQVVFRPWMRRYITVEEGWRIVDDAYRPEEPEDPLDPGNESSSVKRANR